MLFLLFSFCYLVSLITGHIGQIFCQVKVSKGIGVTKSNVSGRNCYESTGFDTGFSQIFVIFAVLFVGVSHILDNYRSQKLPLEE